MSKHRRKDLRRAAFRRHMAPLDAAAREFAWLQASIRAGLDVVPNRGRLGFAWRRHAETVAAMVDARRDEITELE